MGVIFNGGLKLALKNTGHVRSLAALLISFTITFWGPLNTYFLNYTTFRIPLLYAFIASTLFFIITFVSVFLLLCLINHKLLPYAVSFIVSLSCYFWFSSSFLDWNLGVLDGHYIDWDPYLFKGKVEIILLMISIFIMLLSRKKVVAQISKIVIFLLTLQLLNLFYLGLTKPNIAIPNKILQQLTDNFSFSPEQNVVIIVLDTYANDIFDSVVKEKVELKGVFKDFTYFKNTMSKYPTTMPSLPMLLHGRCYKNEEGSFSSFQTTVMNKNSLPLLLENEGYRIPQITYYNSRENKVANEDTIKLTFAIAKYWLNEYNKNVVQLSMLKQRPLLELIRK